MKLSRTSIKERLAEITKDKLDLFFVFRWTNIHKRVFKAGANFSIEGTILSLAIKEEYGLTDYFFSNMPGKRFNDLVEYVFGLIRAKAKKDFADMEVHKDIKFALRCWSPILSSAGEEEITPEMHLGDDLYIMDSDTVDILSDIEDKLQVEFPDNEDDG